MKSILAPRGMVQANLTSDKSSSETKKTPLKKHLSDKNVDRGAFRNEINIVNEGTPLPSHLEQISSVKSSLESVSVSTSKE